MHSAELTDYHATAYPGNEKLYNCVPNCATEYIKVQLCISTFIQEKAKKNDVMITAYHQWHHDVVTTSYLLLHSLLGMGECIRFSIDGGHPDLAIT